MSVQASASKRVAIRQAIRQFMYGEEGVAGAALVEVTIVGPILVIMGVYAADFGLLFYKKMQIQNAAQAGAQWVIANRVYNSADIQVAVKNATSLPASGTSVSSSQFCGCTIDSSGNAVVTQLSATACTPNLTCNTNGVQGNYVTVTASTTYSSLIPYGLISSSYNISATATARVQ